MWYTTSMKVFFVSLYHLTDRGVGPKGASLLSEALKVNSSLTELNLNVFVLLSLLLCYIQLALILVQKEHLQYQKHSRLIQH